MFSFIDYFCGFFWNVVCENSVPFKLKKQTKQWI
nr:MAG TPA: hypothetical protein [Caudoviricetes sp.]